MELIISDEKTKELLEEIIIDLIKNRRELFYEVIVEALEEVSLANAITEGRENKFVAEAEIFSILEKASL
jgi:hypothetical protein